MCSRAFCTPSRHYNTDTAVNTCTHTHTWLCLQTRPAPMACRFPFVHVSKIYNPHDTNKYTPHGTSSSGQLFSHRTATHSSCQPNEHQSTHTPFATDFSTTMSPKDQARKDNNGNKKRKATSSFFADDTDTRQNSSKQGGCPYDQLPDVIREKALQKAKKQHGQTFEARRIAKVLTDRAEREKNQALESRAEARELLSQAKKAKNTAIRKKIDATEKERLTKRAGEKEQRLKYFKNISSPNAFQERTAAAMAHIAANGASIKARNASKVAAEKARRATIASSAARRQNNRLQKKSCMPDKRCVSQINPSSVSYSEFRIIWSMFYKTYTDRTV